MQNYISGANKIKINIKLIIIALIAIGVGIFALAMISHQTPYEKPPPITEQQATEMGREFLENILGQNQIGKVLFINLVSEIPSGYLYYWHKLGGLEIPEVPRSESYWMIRFEQAHRPGHFFEVLVDACTGKIIGGMQCK